MLEFFYIRVFMAKKIYYLLSAKNGDRQINIK